MKEQSEFDTTDDSIFATANEIHWKDHILMMAACQKYLNGAISKTPVKTQFGWHVIKRVDSRKVEPPKFEDVKKQLQQILQNQRVQAYMQELRKNSKIEVK